MSDVSVIGIDLAKSVFGICGRDAAGHVLFKKMLRRPQLRTFLATLPKCRVGMEACGGAHYWGRELRAMGHDVHLMSPQFVKPYVKTNKNDIADAEAISEAVTRPNMRFVSIKSVEQQDMLSVHRIRERLVKNRTALVNQVRGLLQEYGIVMPAAITRFRRELPRFLADETNGLTLAFRDLLRSLSEECVDLDERLAQYERRIQQAFNANEQCQRLAQIPGVGPLTATAVVATVADPHVFKKGRHLSAWLGLVPRQHSSGGRDLLLGISKRGDTYVRRLLIHGARTVIRHVGLKEDRQSQWLRDLKERRGYNKACVALANKNARRIWALMAYDQPYRA